MKTVRFCTCKMKFFYTTFKELFAGVISGISGIILNIDPGYFANYEDISGDKKLFSLFFSSLPINHKAATIHRHEAGLPCKKM